MKFQLKDGGAQIAGVEAETARQIERILLPPASGAKSITRFECDRWERGGRIPSKGVRSRLESPSSISGKCRLPSLR
jgi:hypothetical protein